MLTTTSTSASSRSTWTAMPTQEIFANNICYLTGLENSGNPVFLDGNGNNPAGLISVSNGYYNPNGTTNFAVASFPGNLSFSEWASSVTGGEAGSLQSSPGFSATPSPGACTITASVGPQPCPTQPTLGSGSAYKGAGTNLSNAPDSVAIGLQDYYSNTIPNATTSGTNIGAYGGN